MSVAGVTAAAAAIAQGIKASGVLIRMDPKQFVRILHRQQAPLIVHATGWFFRTNYQYLTSYKGLAFFTKSSAPLNLPQGSEVIQVESIWIP
jgi:hypothetical protein